MTYSLKEAAEAVGKGKPAVLKSIQSGKISAKKDEHGEWQIDPAELHRVYPPVSEAVKETGSEETEETIGNTNGNSYLAQELRFLREKLADIEQLKDEERRSLTQRIEELRSDRDDLRAERDKLLKVIEEQAGSVRVLTDQRPKEQPEDRQRTGFFGRLFGRG